MKWNALSGTWERRRERGTMRLASTSTPSGQSEWADCPEASFFPPLCLFNSPLPFIGWQMDNRRQCAFWGELSESLTRSRYGLTLSLSLTLSLLSSRRDHCEMRGSEYSSLYCTLWWKRHRKSNTLLQQFIRARFILIFFVMYRTNQQ